MMRVTGPDRDTPVKMNPGIGETVPALMLCIGLLAAVHRAREFGEGQFVDVAMTDCVLVVYERIVCQTSYTGVVPTPECNRDPLICPFGLFRASDAYVFIACPHNDFWQKLATAIDRPELIKDEAFATNAARVRNARALCAEVRPCGTSSLR